MTPNEKALPRWDDNETIFDHSISCPARRALSDTCNCSVRNSPRIPSPDESEPAAQPAREACPTCGAENKRYNYYCEDPWHQANPTKLRDASPCPVTPQMLHEHARYLERNTSFRYMAADLHTVAQWLEEHQGEK